MTILERYFVQEIEKDIAQDLMIAKHYLHRRAPCIQSFGLFDREQDNKLVGALMFGVSASSTLLKGVCGADEAGNVMELTRLWIEDGTPKNTESFFIGYCLKLCKRQIVVSFAQIDAGHVGTVYQATNWIYTGLSAKFKDPKHKGEFKNKHHTTWAHGMTNKQIIDTFGDMVEFVERPRKHRYVYFNLNGLGKGAAKKRKVELLQKLKYKILPYPKQSIVYSKP